MGVEEKLKRAAFFENGIGTNRNLLTASITPELWLHLLLFNGSRKLQEAEVLIAKRKPKGLQAIGQTKKHFLINISPH